MMYIHQVGMINYKETEPVDIKAQCKSVAPKFVRRTDHFIQLAILGVEQIKKQVSIESNCALYLTSGQGNLGVFQRLCDQRFVEKMPPKPVDFINSLSNTAGFYISQFMGLDSKNSNLSHLSFVVEMALLLAKSDLLLNKEEAILLGGVDQLLTTRDFAHTALGLPRSIELGQGSNWLYLKNSPVGAIANIDTNNIEMNNEELIHYLSTLSFEKKTMKIGFSPLVSDFIVSDILEKTQYKQYHYAQKIGFYETMALAVINHFIINEQGWLIFIDYFEGKYRTILVSVL